MTGFLRAAVPAPSARGARDALRLALVTGGLLRFLCKSQGSAAGHVKCGGVVSKENKEIKITDKRMFTPDGELREEYRFLEEKSTAAPLAGDVAASPPPASASNGVAAAGAAARPDEAAAAPPGSAQPPASGRSSRRAAAAREEPPPRGSAGPGGAAAGRGAADTAGIAGGDARVAAGYAEAASPTGPAGGAGPAGAGWAADEPSARLEFPSSAPGLGPSFYDLAALLAEPVALYLGDMELPDGQSAENLEMARLYIDLLDVLRQKTAGNLTAQEAAFLEDLLYRLRVRYVQKRG
jgi:hypothetical protein